MTSITVNVVAGASVTGGGVGGTGIVLDGSNAINNSGTVTGVSNGIVATTGNTIVNTGTITGSSSRGIQVTNNNTITNSNSISAAQTGIQVGTGNTVNNTGTITGIANGIVSNSTPNTNVVNNGGTISSTSGNGVSLFGTVANTGTISGVTAVNSVGPGSVTITNSSTGIISGAPISGLNATINFGASGLATITNDGTIRVTTAQGTAIAASNAAITNNATGSISGATNGISITGGAGTGSVTNSGTIQATIGTGVIFTLGGTVTNQAGGVITGGGGTGVRFTGSTASTFTNHGTVNGAVSMSTGNDTIALGTASVITGAIDGRGGTNTLQLIAGTPPTGTLSSTLLNITTLTVNAAGSTWVVTGSGTPTGGTTISAGTLQIGNGGAAGDLGGDVVNNGTFAVNRSDTYTFAGAISGTGSFVQRGSGTTILTGANAYSGGTTVSVGTLQGNTTSLQGNITDNAALVFDQAVAGTYAGVVSGTGTFTKQGVGTLTLMGTNTYGGPTSVAAGTLQAGAANAFSANSAVSVAAGATLALNTFNQAIGSLSGAGGVSLGSAVLTTGNDNTSTTFSGSIAGTGGLAKIGSGTLFLTGANTYTGATTVNGGTLSVNGSLASSVTVNSGGTLGGTGAVAGLTNNGIVAPGNSIGTLTVTGNFVQAAGGTYQVEVNAAGQSDRINVGGTATLQGGTVQVLAQPGTYARNTTYTILNATAGVSGAYSTVTSNFAFLTPSLSYDANNVYLLLAQNQSAFAAGAQTPNQFAVGTALDIANPTASGDFNTVLNALSVLDMAQGPAALDAISGQNYAGFSNAMVQGAQLFMNNFSERAGSSGQRGNRVALAEACDVACDTTSPALWGAWGGALGGTGTIAGNSNAGALTYSVGGFAAGLDRRFAPNLLAGVTVGYQTGGQWTGGFDGRGTTDTVQAGLYASFTEGPAYVDGIAGYAYSSNRMWRNIAIPGLSTRTTQGQTGANQFYGQIETGYRFDFGGPAEAFVTPFARLQGSTATQNAFSETGASSLSLSVAAQTTNSLRSVIGAQLGGAVDLGWRDKLAAQFRLGWSHEYADTARPVSATFAGAPTVPFTTFGAAPQRDGVVLGFSASTAIAEAISVYLRYEGEIAGQDSSHALIAGLRMTW